jgi:hypothetical protein
LALFRTTTPNLQDLEAEDLEAVVVTAAAVVTVVVAVMEVVVAMVVVVVVESVMANREEAESPSLADTADSTGRKHGPKNGRRMASSSHG